MSDKEPDENLTTAFGGAAAEGTGSVGDAGLPPQLRAFEGELAALRPSPGGLDRDRLMFLAGRASVCGHRHRAFVSGRRWAWPGAFAGMTAVAASLLVVLMIRPAPQIVERRIEVPSPPSADATAQPAVNGVASQAEQKPSPLPEPRRPAPPSGTPRRAMAVGGGWLGRSVFGTAAFEAPYLQTLDRVLREGPDSWAPPQPGPRRPATEAAGPSSYREMLESLLEPKRHSSSDD